MHECQAKTTENRHQRPACQPRRDGPERPRQAAHRQSLKVRLEGNRGQQRREDPRVGCPCALRFRSPRWRESIIAAINPCVRFMNGTRNTVKTDLGARSTVPAIGFSKTGTATGSAA